jgi:aspartate kinase
MERSSPSLGKKATPKSMSKSTVLKFGGTSICDAAAIRRAGEIVASTHHPVVICSAAGGVTDRLVALAERAVVGEDAAIVEELSKRHSVIAEELQLDPEEIAGPLESLRDCARGMALFIEDSAHARDRLLACGELLMAPIFAAHLRKIGVDAVAVSAAKIGLLTDGRHGRARPLPECFDHVAAGLAEHAGRVPVITGFIGRTADGRITTLGRGGSDYSASIVARAIGAGELQIWTDVVGIRTADPRLVPDAGRISHLTFREASELAYSGAKVLHPQTLTPAMDGGIPVQVRNTRHPDRPGTSITEQLPAGVESSRIRAIAHRSGVRVITIVSPRMFARHGFLSRIAEVFDRHELSIDMISTSEVSISLTPDDHDAPLASLIADLESFADVELVEGQGMVSVVGDRIDADGTAVAEILTAVARLRAPIRMISYGATRTNLTFLIPDEHLVDVVRELHSLFFPE